MALLAIDREYSVGGASFKTDPGKEITVEMTLRRVCGAYSEVPVALKRTAQWVGWRLEEDREHPAKPRKVPMNPWVPWQRASTTNPKTWSGFERALRAAQATPTWDGIGIVFRKSLTGIDLDRCADVPMGNLSRWALEIVRLMDSYTEWSPSGLGLHIIAHGTVPSGGSRRGSVELYDSARFFTVTGNHLQSTPRRVQHRQHTITSVHSRWILSSSVARSHATSSKRAHPRVLLTDHEILSMAFRSRNGRRIAALFSGDSLGYASPSEADLALCGFLARWCDGDLDRVDELFRKSGLYRPKWDERRGSQTYGQRTLLRVAAGVSRASPASLIGAEVRRAEVYPFDQVSIQARPDWLLQR